VVVKVPTADGSYNEYNTKEGVYNAVSPIILEWFQSILVASCHQGKFFEEISHLADGPMVQQILEGTYIYPPDIWTRQHGYCSKKQQLPTLPYYPLPSKHMSPQMTFNIFGAQPKNKQDPPIADHYIATSYCPDLSLLHAAKLSICARNGVTLARWGMGLTVLLKKILGNVFVHKLCAICLLEADFNWWEN
jgi:hypothetical protein